MQGEDSESPVSPVGGANWAVSGVRRAWPRGRRKPVPGVWSLGAFPAAPPQVFGVCVPGGALDKRTGLQCHVSFQRFQKEVLGAGQVAGSGGLLLRGTDAQGLPGSFSREHGTSSPSFSIFLLHHTPWAPGG